MCVNRQSHGYEQTSADQKGEHENFIVSERRKNRQHAKQRQSISGCTVRFLPYGFGRKRTLRSKAKIAVLSGFWHQVSQNHEKKADQTADPGCDPKGVCVHKEQDADIYDQFNKRNGQQKQVFDGRRLGAAFF